MQYWRYPLRLEYGINMPFTQKRCLKKNISRGIALGNVTYKILSYCILDRIKHLAKNIIGDYQSGFRNKSTIDQIFIIRQLFQKT
jgi:hypothetical protein